MATIENAKYNLDTLVLYRHKPEDTTEYRVGVIVGVHGNIHNSDEVRYAVTNGTVHDTSLDEDSLVWEGDIIAVFDKTRSMYHYLYAAIKNGWTSHMQNEVAGVDTPVDGLSLSDTEATSMEAGNIVLTMDDGIFVVGSVFGLTSADPDNCKIILQLSAGEDEHFVFDYLNNEEGWIIPIPDDDANALKKFFNVSEDEEE